MSPRTASRAVDWPEVRRRVDELRRVLDRDARPAPEQLRQILRARARELARPVAAWEETREREVLTLELDGGSYAFDVRRVVEVGRTANVVPLPGAPPPLLGLTEWRGKVLLLVDLPSMLGRASGSPVRSHQIVLGDQNTTFGVLIDAVGEVRAIGQGDVTPVPATFTDTTELAAGMLSSAVLVLDHDALVRRVAQLR